TSHSSRFHAAGAAPLSAAADAAAPPVVHQPPDVRHGPAASTMAPHGRPRRDGATWTGRPRSTLTRSASGGRRRLKTRSVPPAPAAASAPRPAGAATAPSGAYGAMANASGR